MALTDRSGQNQKRVGFAQIKDTSTDTIIFTNVPVAFTVAEGVEQTAKPETTPSGEIGHGGFVSTTRRPLFTLNFSKGKATPQLAQFVFLRKYAESSATVTLSRNIYIPTGSGNYAIPAETNVAKLGYGMSANVASAAILDNTSGGYPDLSSVQLTRSAYNASPGVLGSRTFMQGADGAYFFSGDLRGSMVSLSWDQTINTIAQTDQGLGIFELILMIPSEAIHGTGSQYEIFNVPECEVVAGATYDPAAETWNIGFQVLLSGVNGCDTYKHYFTTLQPPC